MGLRHPEKEQTGILKQYESHQVTLAFLPRLPTLPHNHPLPAPFPIPHQTSFSLLFVFPSLLFQNNIKDNHIGICNSSGQISKTTAGLLCHMPCLYFSTEEGGAWAEEAGVAPSFEYFRLLKH